MSAIVSPKIPDTRYRSMFKPKFWRSNKTTPLMPGLEDAEERNLDKAEEKATDIDSTTTSHTPSLMKMPTMKMPSPSMPSFGKKNDNTMALKETGRNEVYELSTVNDSGVYLPPVTTSLQANGKHDHWLGVDEDAFRFSLPSQDCLTTGLGRPHSFYTPSSIMIST
ncbi:unnamed protein product [Absidia cylindrospora]